MNFHNCKIEAQDHAQSLPRIDHPVEVVRGITPTSDLEPIAEGTLIRSGILSLLLEISIATIEMISVHNAS